MRGGAARVLGAALAVCAAASAAVAAPSGRAGLDRASSERLARLALACVHREYPNKIAHVLSGDEDVRPPRELTPAFYGCYDWHSAVHGHWLLARLARLQPQAPFAAEARAALAKSLTTDNVAAELRYMQGKGRVSFERPYGLAWLLQLGTELREWDDEDARRWSQALAPLEKEAAARVAAWLPKLTNPIRVGEHSQTAFAFGLILDWARRAGERDLERLLEERVRVYYARDRACPLAYEPSGEDFLSPCLAEADLMRRTLAPPQHPPQGRPRMAGAGRGHRPLRPQAGAPRWPQPQPRLDAGGHRLRPAAGRSPPAGAPGRRGRPSRGGAALGHRRALRGRPLAGHLRGLPGDGARAG
jgi:hypothetical protein